MNYIGSKHKLSPWLKTSIADLVDRPLHNLIFCDLFAGTGIVGRIFKAEVKEVIANDIEFYSYALLQHYIGNHQALTQGQQLIGKLNDLPGQQGFIADQYGQNGSAGRLFFSEMNARKIDACRQQIQKWKKDGLIDCPHYYFLLTSLLESADKVANTASVYGAFLKKLKSSAEKKMVIAPAQTIETPKAHRVYNQDADSLIDKIQGDILYLDPPYNARQYGANYHLLNTIARYQKFLPKGKTGLPVYYKSAYCRKNKVLEHFESLVQKARFSHIFLSYNNEGLMKPKYIKAIMEKYGTYRLKTKTYQRFKADKSESRRHKASETTEYLHCLTK